MIPLYDTLRARRIPLVNWILIALNILVFLYEIRLRGSALESFIRTWALIPDRLIDRSADRLGDDFYKYVPAWWLVSSAEQYVGIVHLWR